MQSTPVSSNLASVTVRTDMLKFAAYDEASNKVYISFLRHLETGCVSLSIVVCAFGESPHASGDPRPSWVARRRRALGHSRWASSHFRRTHADR